jgi:hypothetical protein
LPFAQTSATIPEGQISFFRSLACQDLKGTVKPIFREIHMSENLNLLRQRYCRPGSFTSKRNDHLFPLEEECEEGKTLLARNRKAILYLQEFDPHGLQQTYRDEASGAELPVFAVFDLQGSHRLAIEVTTDPRPTNNQPKSLPEHLPFRKAEPFVWKINDRRIKSERVATWLSVLLGMLPVLIVLVFRPIPILQAAVPHILVGGWILGAFLFYLLSLFILNQFCPWKKLAITAEFNGILPKVVREKALAAKDQFDNLYLIVDQQHRWKSDLLRDPRPRLLDPLLIGELKQGDRHKYYLIHQFDLTQAEQYLADEFAVRAQ